MHVYGGGECKTDMKGLGLASTDALDRRSWKRKTVVLIQVCL